MDRSSSKRSTSGSSGQSSASSAAAQKTGAGLAPDDPGVVFSDTLSYFPSDPQHSPPWDDIKNVLGLDQGGFEALYLFIPLVAFGGGVQNTSIVSMTEWEMYFIPFLSILAVNARHSRGSSGSCRVGKSDNTLLWIAIPDPDPESSRDIIGFMVAYLCRKGSTSRVKVSPSSPGRRSGGGRRRVTPASPAASRIATAVELFNQESNQSDIQDASCEDSTAADEWKDMANASVDQTFRRFIAKASGDADPYNFARVVSGYMPFEQETPAQYKARVSKDNGPTQLQLKEVFKHWPGAIKLMDPVMGTCHFESYVGGTSLNGIYSEADEFSRGQRISLTTVLSLETAVMAIARTVAKNRRVRMNRVGDLVAELRKMYCRTVEGEDMPILDLPEYSLVWVIPHTLATPSTLFSFFIPGKVQYVEYHTAAYEQFRENFWAAMSLRYPSLTERQTKAMELHIETRVKRSMSSAKDVQSIQAFMLSAILYVRTLDKDGRRVAGNRLMSKFMSLLNPQTKDLGHGLKGLMEFIDRMRSETGGIIVRRGVDQQRSTWTNSVYVSEQIMYAVTKYLNLIQWQKHVFLAWTTGLAAGLMGTSLDAIINYHGEGGIGKSEIVKAVMFFLVNATVVSYASATTTLANPEIMTLKIFDEAMDHIASAKGKPGEQMSTNRGASIFKQESTQEIVTDSVGTGIVNGVRVTNTSRPIVNKTSTVVVSNKAHDTPWLEAAVAQRFRNIFMPQPFDKEGLDAIDNKNRVRLSNRIAENGGSNELSQIMRLSHSVNANVLLMSQQINLGVMLGKGGLDPDALFMCDLFMFRFRQVIDAMGVPFSKEGRMSVRVSLYAMILQMTDATVLDCLGLYSAVPGKMTSQTDNYREPMLFVTVENTIRAITLLDAYEDVGVDKTLDWVRDRYIDRGMNNDDHKDKFTIVDGCMVCNGFFPASPSVDTKEKCISFLVHSIRSSYPTLAAYVIDTAVHRLFETSVFTFFGQTKQLGVKFEFIYYSRRDIIIKAIRASYFPGADRITIKTFWADPKNGDVGRTWDMDVFHEPLGKTFLGMSDDEYLRELSIRRVPIPKSLAGSLGLSDVPKDKADVAPEVGTCIVYAEENGEVVEKVVSVSSPPASAVAPSSSSSSSSKKKSPVSDEDPKKAAKKTKMARLDQYKDDGPVVDSFPLRSEIAPRSLLWEYKPLSPLDETIEERVKNVRLLSRSVGQATQLVKMLTKDAKNLLERQTTLSGGKQVTYGAYFERIRDYDDSSLADNDHRLLRVEPELLRALAEEMVKIRAIKKIGMSTQEDYKASRCIGTLGIIPDKPADPVPDDKKEEGGRGDLVPRRDSAMQNLAHSRETSARMRLPVLEVDMKMIRTRFEVSKPISQDTAEPDVSRHGSLIRDDRTQMMRGSVGDQVLEDGSIRVPVENIETVIILDETLQHRMNVKFVADRMKISPEAAEKDGRVYSNFYGKIMEAFVKERPPVGKQPRDVSDRDATHLDALAQLNKSDYEKANSGTIGDDHFRLFTVLESYSDALTHQVEVCTDFKALPFGVSMDHVLFWCQDVFTKKSSASKQETDVNLAKAVDSPGEEFASGAINPVVLNFAAAVSSTSGMTGSGSTRVLRHIPLAHILHALCVFQTDEVFSDGLYNVVVMDHLTTKEAVEFFKTAGMTENRSKESHICDVRNYVSSVMIFIDYVKDRLVVQADHDLPHEDEPMPRWFRRLSETHKNFTSLSKFLLNIWCATFARTDKFEVTEEDAKDWFLPDHKIPSSWDEYHLLVEKAIDALWVFADAWRFSKTPVYHEGPFVNPVLEKERRDLMAELDISGLGFKDLAPPSAEEFRANPSSRAPRTKTSIGSLRDGARTSKGARKSPSPRTTKERKRTRGYNDDDDDDPDMTSSDLVDTLMDLGNMSASSSSSSSSAGMIDDEAEDVGLKGPHDDEEDDDDDEEEEEEEEEEGDIDENDPWVAGGEEDDEEEEEEPDSPGAAAFLALVKQHSSKKRKTSK